MRGYDNNDNLEHTIIAKDGNPEAPDLHKPNLNPSPQEMAAQGYETIVSGANHLPYSKERDVTYETGDGFYYSNPIPYRR